MILRLYCRYPLETVNKAIIDSACDNLQVDEVRFYSPPLKKIFFCLLCPEF